MSALVDFFEALFGPLVLVFTVSNLASMGLQIEIPRALATIRNPRFLALVLVWGWVVGPALGYLITRVLPLEQPYAAVMLLTSLAPCAPFLPVLIGKARGDVDFAGAFIPLAAVGTVIFMPLLAPLLIQGMTLSVLSLVKPLVATILIPLLIGALVRTNAPRFAAKAYPPVKWIAGGSTVLTVVCCLVLYGKPMLATTGSLALVSMTLFMLVMGALTYFVGFGLEQNQRSMMSLGMGTRNIAAVLAGVLAIPDGDPRMTAMVVMWTLWSFILARIAAPLFARQVVPT